MSEVKPWTVRITELRTDLRVGVYPHEQQAQPILVSLVLSGAAKARPEALEHCLDYEPICRWITSEWCHSAHTPLLEVRVNQLLAQVFRSDHKIASAWVGLYKPTPFPMAKLIGVERAMTRQEFEQESAAHASRAAAHRGEDT